VFEVVEVLVDLELMEAVVVLEAVILLVELDFQIISQDHL
jgi:hypothetical protein